MQTTIIKSSDGRKAETQIELNAKRALKIDTRKGGRGVQTSAIVIEPTNTGFMWSPFNDFSETLREGRGLRCTEKTGRDEHTQALASIDGALTARALARYSNEVQPR